MKNRTPNAADLWTAHHGQWRDPMEVVTQWQNGDAIDPRLFESKTRGDFWGVLNATGATLFVTREYEHLVLALGGSGRSRVTALHLPHPSGLAVDRDRGVVHIASTRNPNQIFRFAPATVPVVRRDMKGHDAAGDRLLVPVGSDFYPGCLYLHDLALIGKKLYGNAVGLNAVVELSRAGYKAAWWPKAIDAGGKPDASRNYLQLNSIAAGPTLGKSFFSASAERPSARRPGHRNFPVDGRGVIFSAATREPMLRGLTRPHSARLHGGEVWVDNSGYGELGFARGGKLEVVAKLPGWTRGLCFVGDVAFVGTSRVIPRFAQYAPGLKVEDSQCGLHAVESKTGKILGSLLWPNGNQIFAIDWAPAGAVRGFPFAPGGARARRRERNFFYAYGHPDHRP